MRLPENYILPEGFDLMSLVESQRVLNYMNRRPEYYSKACYFISLINWFGFVGFYSREEEGGWIQLSSKFLEGIIGHGNPRLIRAMLVDLGIIEVDESYSPGVRSMRFRLKAPYANRQQVELDIPLIPFLQRIQRYNLDSEQRQRRAAMNPPYGSIRDALGSFQFKPEVNGYIQRFTGRRQSYRQLCKDFINGRKSFFSIDGKSGRCFHALTSTPKEMRKLLVLNGEETVEIDIPSAQPLLAATLYDLREQSHTKEMDRYLRFVEGGFYEKIAKAAGSRLKKRDAIKRACYSEVFFNPAQSTGLLWRAMEREFPILARLITAQKLRGRSAFAIYLQRTEAEVVIHDVGEKLSEAGKLFATVHDAIICRKSDARLVRRMMKRAVEQKIGGELKLRFF